VSYNYLALARRPAMLIPTQTREDNNVASVQAGVVAGADLYSQPATPTGFSASLQSPGTWTYLWVGFALLYLIGIYVGAIRVAGRGE